MASIIEEQPPDDTDALPSPPAADIIKRANERIARVKQQRAADRLLAREPSKNITAFNEEEAEQQPSNIQQATPSNNAASSTAAPPIIIQPDTPSPHHPDEEDSLYTTTYNNSTSTKSRRQWCCTRDSDAAYLALAFID
uniref:Uncharacterized protein n=1 Tax=Ditylum brightwellii TaxID=49249 RepID=A0A7S1YXY2_9STRA|mmetsp:Transcript_2008/g.3189  ORF Transcript_2008/g.3189 Transcript_2008/m.3189 type:complete len:139 (+) Transcript_2008:381-797(+)